METTVISSQGTPVTLDDLPPPTTRRWVVARKADVIAGVHAGLLSVDQACERYRLSLEEFRSWERLIKSYGYGGLRVTRTQEYRRLEALADILEKVKQL